MEGLSERERSMLVLSFIVERSAEEVGRELGLTPGNAHVIRHRAILGLKKGMSGGGAVRGACRATPYCVALLVTGPVKAS